MGSPARKPSMDALKDADARIRALTREVGSLREDLRREVKRRERAVAQAQQHEAANTAAQAKLQELGYANRKLASDLDAAHDAARKAADRDKRALHRLREGLCMVEQEVQARGQRGCQLAGAIKSNLTELRAVLFDLPGATHMAELQAQQVRACITAAIASLMDLSDCLTGPHTSEAATGAVSSMPVVGGVASQMDAAEHQQAKDEISRLRSELRSVVDKAAGAAGAASLELQSLLGSSQAEVAALKAEAARLQAALQVSEEQAAGLQARVESLQSQLSSHESVGQEAAVRAEQLAALRVASDDQVAALREANTRWQQHYQSALQENHTLRAEVQRLTRELSEAGWKLEEFQSSLQEQQRDMQAAMQLVARQQHTQHTSTSLHLPHNRHTHITHHVSPVAYIPGLGLRPGGARLGVPDVGPRPASSGPPGVHNPSDVQHRPRPLSAGSPALQGIPTFSPPSFQSQYHHDITRPAPAPHHQPPQVAVTTTSMGMTTSTRPDLPPSVAAKAAAAHHLLKSQLPGPPPHTNHASSPPAVPPTWPLTSSTTYNVQQQAVGAAASRPGLATSSALHSEPLPAAYKLTAGTAGASGARAADKAVAAATAAAVAARLKAQHVPMSAAAARPPGVGTTGEPHLVVPSTTSSITSASDISMSSITLPSSHNAREVTSQSRATAGGSGAGGHSMDKLMREVKGLDAEIAALEASMQSIASSVGVAGL